MQSRRDSERSQNRKDFHAAFVIRVHQLLEAGYRRMQPVRRFEMWKEEEISGELGRHIDEVLDEIGEPWMRFFSLAPERHVDQPHLPLKKRRLGKCRKRLDFRFTCRQRTPVPRFVVEAKSIKQSGTSQLLDDDGLGRILAGHYAREDAAAGLVGYIQVGTTISCAQALAEELNANAPTYRITSGGSWTKIGFPASPDHTYHTQHNRLAPLPEVNIYFTLFLFR